MLSSSCKSFTATRRPFLCTAAKTVAMPPTPSTRSMPYLPARIVPMRRAARSSWGTEKETMGAFTLTGSALREPWDERGDAPHVLGVGGAAGERAAVEHRDGGEGEQRRDGERAHD